MASTPTAGPEDAEARERREQLSVLMPVAAGSIAGGPYGGGAQKSSGYSTLLLPAAPRDLGASSISAKPESDDRKAGSLDVPGGGVRRGAQGRIVHIKSVPDEVSPTGRWASSSPDAASQRSPLAAAGGAAASASSSAVGSPPRREVSAALRRQREQARKRKQLEERPGFKPTLAPKDRPGWNGRHQNIYENVGLHQNVRCYFDRQLKARPPGEEPPKGQVLKPSWRLDPNGQSAEERSRSAAAFRAMSAAPPVSPKAAAAGDASKPTKAPFQVGGPKVVVPAAASELTEDRASRKVSDKAAEWFQAPMPGGYAAPAEGDWDGHHHITWCNEQKVGDYSRLNPSQFRSYFGRTREPDVGARSRELRKPREDGRGEEVRRVLPVWRLEPLPGRDSLPDEEELKVRPEVLHGNSGFGGDPRQHPTGTGLTKEVEFDLTTTSRSFSSPNLQEGRREKRWCHRHQVVFKNEEVSRLDRCYFDRFREAECLLSPDKKKGRSGGVHVWSLEHSAPIEESAKLMSEATEARFRADGKWDDRHHLTFDNRIHQNARSYFERPRDFPTEAPPPHLLQMTDPTTLPGPAHRDPTAAVERKRREKVEDKDRMVVMWSLQEPDGPEGRTALVDSLRRCDSEPNAREARRKERRRGAWFSSHGVDF